MKILFITILLSFLLGLITELTEPVSQIIIEYNKESLKLKVDSLIASNENLLDKYQEIKQLNQKLNFEKDSLIQINLELKEKLNEQSTNVSVLQTIIYTVLVIIVGVIFYKNFKLN
jgi:cell division GTPase FtsZ